ncbi:hypothetical protein AB1I56_02910 [Staphylococcus epidermidis]
MRKILKGIILSLIIIGLIKTFNEYDVILYANHYFEQIKSEKIIEDIKIDYFNNYHNINFEDLNPSDFFNIYVMLIEKKIKT